MFETVARRSESQAHYPSSGSIEIGWAVWSHDGRVRRVAASMTAAGGLLVALCLAACGSQPGGGGASGSAALGRPGCPPPTVTLVGTGSRFSTAAGDPVSIAAVVGSASYLRVMRLRIVVAPASATLDIAPAGTAQEAKSVLNSSNQLAQAEITDLVPAGQQLALNFKPSTSGKYQIAAIATYTAAHDCLPPAPAAASSSVVTTAVIALGEINVN